MGAFSLRFGRQTDGGEDGGPCSSAQRTLGELLGRGRQPARAKKLLGGSEATLGTDPFQWDTRALFLAQTCLVGVYFFKIFGSSYSRMQLRAAAHATGPQEQSQRRDEVMKSPEGWLWEGRTAWNRS